MVRDYLELSRPKDWVKNVFVFMPVPFALASGATLNAKVFALGLCAFCMANSAVYSFNDAQDAERDRAHDKKKERPVASGRVSERGAYLWSGSLAVLATALAYASGNQSGNQGALTIVGIYLGVNLVYCLGAKNIALLDVFLLSSGFVLRVLLGCALLRVPPSNPMLLCSYALALFLALAKRRADVIKGLDGSHRPSLLGYNQAFLDHAMGITASMAVVGYALYSMESAVLIPSRKFASLPFVMFGVLDYLRLVHVRKTGGSPVDVLLASPGLVATGIGWLIAVIWSVKLP
ncbi:MAG TPA: UbiA prenyltransferase family protein [Polyangiales bacterium]